MDLQTDVLVIGAGAVGICAAHYLREAGRQVWVVEKAGVGSGCSHGNAGLVVPGHCTPLAAPGMIARGFQMLFRPRSPFYIKPRLSYDLLQWLWLFARHCNEAHFRRAVPVLLALGRESGRLFDELASSGGVDFGYTRNGVLEVFATPRGFRSAVAEAQRLETYGVRSRVLDRGELSQWAAGMHVRAEGGLLHTEDGHLIPDRFVHRMAARLKEKGVRLLEATEVLGFAVRGRRVTAVQTTRGDIAAEQFVLAGGSAAALLARDLGVRLPIQPAKGYSWTFRRPAIDLARPIILAEAKVVVTPMGDTLRLAGTLELAGHDPAVNKPRLQAIRDALPRYLPELARSPLQTVEIWRGLRPCSPDGLPFVGRPRRWDNLILAAGHGMLGISLAPVTGKLVSRLAANTVTTPELNALAVDRFR
jgi:D-amino-acid dehydrogenase